MNAFHYTADLPETIFRAYDIRGIVNEALTGDVVYTITKSIAAQAIEVGQTTVVVGCDGRLSSPLLVQAVISGLIESGVDVINIGRIPTPLVYFATHFLLSRSGIMVTGSHNPANYNGLKIVIKGETLADEGIKGLYKRAIERRFTEGKGHILNVDIIPAYIARVVSDIKIKRPLKVVVDAGNGITGKVAPNLFRALGCEVVELYCQVDGEFPNHHPDPNHEKNLQDLIQSVLKEQADIGFAFDGDGDRLGVVTNKGEIIWPDRQLMCFAGDILREHDKATILFDVKCSKHLKEVILQHGGTPLMWKTGHSYIKNKMKEVGALLGGEMSGHIFFKHRWYGFDDALYSAARLLEIITAKNKDTSSFFSAFPNGINTPEIQLPMAEEQKFGFISNLIAKANFPGGMINTIDGLRVDFPHGFGLVRASNTTPSLVLRFEADTMDHLKAIQSIFKTELLAVNPTLDLPF